MGRKQSGDWRGKTYQTHSGMLHEDHLFIFMTKNYEVDVQI